MKNLATIRCLPHKEHLNRFCMKCYVSEKEFLNYVKSPIVCQDHKLMTLFLF